MLFVLKAIYVSRQGMDVYLYNTYLCNMFNLKYMMYQSIYLIMSRGIKELLGFILWFVMTHNSELVADSKEWLNLNLKKINF